MVGGGGGGGVYVEGNGIPDWCGIGGSRLRRQSSRAAEQQQGRTGQDRAGRWVDTVYSTCTSVAGRRVGQRYATSAREAMGNKATTRRCRGAAASRTDAPGYMQPTRRAWDTPAGSWEPAVQISLRSLPDQPILTSLVRIDHRTRSSRRITSNFWVMALEPILGPSAFRASSVCPATADLKSLALRLNRVRR